MAVREGNDILVLQACYDNTITPLRVMRDPNTPEGKADITTEGNTHTVCCLFEIYYSAVE